MNGYAMRLRLTRLTLSFARVVRIERRSQPPVGAHAGAKFAPAGFQYYSGSIHWQEMRVGDTLTLVREADNPHDASAVRVEWRGEKLGYLPRMGNREVAAEMDRGGQVEARIAALTETRTPGNVCGSRCLLYFETNAGAPGDKG